MKIFKLFVLVTLIMIALSYTTADREDVDNAKDTARKWLLLMDEGRYDQSWYQTSSRFQAMFPLADFVKTMREKRSPMGRVLRRSMLEQRVANNPKNLPEGFYMILYYHTKFAGEDRLVGEFITLIEDENGMWHILSYQLI